LASKADVLCLRQHFLNMEACGTHRRANSRFIGSHAQQKSCCSFAQAFGAWKGVRMIKEGELDHELFGFLTCEPNGVVAPIHQKAMPVILRSAAEVEQWLTAPTSEALELQRPLPDDELVILPKAA
jgi:putative SOS response-associated peptidase YedK